MNELLVFRHAKTERDSSTGRDFDRALAQRGLSDARAAGQWLQEQALVPDKVVSSTAVRAMETAQLACRACNFPVSEIEAERGIYEAFPGTLLAIVGRHLQSRRLMMVGHNPGFEMLVTTLTGQRVIMPTAAIAVLCWDHAVTELTEQRARLSAVWTPKRGTDAR